MKLDLMDLQPQEAELSLSEKPGKKYTLGKITLRTRIWLRSRFKEEEITNIFTDQRLAEVSEIAYHLLKDKADFPTLESFQECLVTRQDFLNLMQAMLSTLGLSEPVIDKLAQEALAQGNEQSLSPPTGAPSST